jgi:hypothetical protein
VVVTCGGGGLLCVTIPGSQKLGVCGQAEFEGATVQMGADDAGGGNGREWV